MDDLDAAQPGRGDEAGEVGDRSAADGHDGITAGEAGPAEPAPQPGGDLRGLGGLGVGHGRGVHLVAGAEGGRDGSAGAGQRLGVDDEDALHPGGRAGAATAPSRSRPMTTS